MKNLKETINQYIKEEDRLRDKYQEYSLDSIWKDVAGATVSKYTTKIQLRGDVLTVFIQSAPLKQELLFASDTLLQKLNDQLQYKSVKKLIIK